MIDFCRRDVSKTDFRCEESGGLKRTVPCVEVMCRIDGFGGEKEEPFKAASKLRSKTRIYRETDFTAVWTHEPYPTAWEFMRAFKVLKLIILPLAS